MWSDFYSRWAKALFKKPSWADYISAISGTAIGVVGAYWPRSMLVEHSWQVPLYGFAALGILRFFAAPYEIWKEQKEKADLVDAQIAQQVTIRMRRPPDYLESLRAHTDISVQKYLLLPSAYEFASMISCYSKTIEETGSTRGGMYVVMSISESLRKIEHFLTVNEKNLSIHSPTLNQNLQNASAHERFDVIEGADYIKAHQDNVITLVDFVETLAAENLRMRVTLSQMHEQIAYEAQKVIADE